MDSRVLLASAIGSQEITNKMEAITFEIAPCEESQVSQQIARSVDLKWQSIEQGIDTYWGNFGGASLASNGLYSICHTHTYHSARQLSVSGFDSVLTGWGLDLFFSGSYLPKSHTDILGRQLFNFKSAHCRQRRSDRLPHGQPGYSKQSFRKKLAASILCRALGEFSARNLVRTGE